MNAKRCKVLRLLAREMTVGAPVRRFVRHRHWLINAPGTTRGAYRAMKRADQGGDYGAQL